ncbi:MAG TPA: cyanophycinase [Vicinamibacterales bacterium]|nr:cyanophycinase [Vicinamibacterales bacterium]
MTNRAAGVERRVASSSRGVVILIGGSEDKQGARVILSEVARRSGTGTLVVATLASDEPELQWERYRRVFTELGVRRIAHLAVANREDIMDGRLDAMCDDASAVFFTGGDQVRIVTKLGGTTLLTRLRARFAGGALFAGTSAGASVMGETMLVSRETSNEVAHKVDAAFYMTRGLGLIADMVIDQHFAQRARIERLIGAIAENPGVVGVGIDEDTGIVVEPDGRFHVLGAGAVYVADGRSVTHTNMSEDTRGHTLCLFDVTLHVLNHGTGFDVTSRRPLKDTHLSPATTASSTAT